MSYHSIGFITVHLSLVNTNASHMIGMHDEFVCPDWQPCAPELLIAFWDKEGEICSEQSQFLDLGCGNGLLVYILSQENCKGSGIDLRKRKIWDWYGHGVMLQVVHPSCNFFLLPCCTYDFFGKFQRDDDRSSSYRCYLEYLSNVAEKCGFTTCIIGQHSSVLPHESILKNIETMLLHSRGETRHENNEEPTSDSSSALMAGFKVQEKQQARNCTLLSKDVTHSIICKVVPQLLKSENWIILQRHGSERRWNLGSKFFTNQY
ncbi:unnamed protein product [Soboliphyme baturini]|uniref:tRNA (uracil-O(2)-)-methyltransferase n=1 Tax=Soboliphyme baturini TaxID=241478 RepID=A0A183INV0_9BILA|nr:unnamed protein product [Soboliphyme baturini]